MPVSVVRSNLPEIRERARSRGIDYRELISRSPVLADAIVDESHAPTVVKHAEAFANLERHATMLEAAGRGIDMIQQSYGATAEGIGEGYRDPWLARVGGGIRQRNLAEMAAVKSTSLQDVWNDPSLAGQFVKELIAEQALLRLIILHNPLKMLII